MPEASGSSVPAWPAFLAFSARFTAATAWVEVMPTALSSTIQPFTSRFFGRSCGARRFLRSSLMAALLVFAVVGRLLGIAPDAFGAQERVDPRRLVEALVTTE